MAKAIKFNLICDECSIRTIEELQNNFSIEDVLDYYKNKLLHRWLDVRGYKAELEKVSKIVSTEPVKIIKELIKIFDIDADDEKVEESVYMIKYTDEHKKQCDKYNLERCNVDQIIEDQKNGYMRLLDGIIKNPHNISMIKANIAEIVSKYEWIFRLNHRELFFSFFNIVEDEHFNKYVREINYKYIAAIMCLLMNEKSRKYYLPNNDDKTIRDNIDKKEMYISICRLIEDNEVFEDALQGNLHKYSGYTDGYWKDLEPKGKKYMIIKIDEGDYVRSSGAFGKDLSFEDVKNKFVIVDGIDYKSNSSWHSLLYMEV